MFENCNYPSGRTRANGQLLSAIAKVPEKTGPKTRSFRTKSRALSLNGSDASLDDDACAAHGGSIGIIDSSKVDAEIQAQTPSCGRTGSRRVGKVGPAMVPDPVIMHATPQGSENSGGKWTKKRLKSERGCVSAEAEVDEDSRESGSRRRKCVDVDTNSPEVKRGFRWFNDLASTERKLVRDKGTGSDVGLP